MLEFAITPNIHIAIFKSNRSGQRDNIQIHLVGYSTYIRLPHKIPKDGFFMMCKSAGLAQGPVYAMKRL